MFMEKHPCEIYPESALSVEIVNSLLNYITLKFSFCFYSEMHSFLIFLIFL